MTSFPIDTTNLSSIDKLLTGAVWTLKTLPKEAFFTIGVLTADHDGDPMAYGDKKKHPEITPHDRLSYAGHPGNWWAVVTDNGRPSGKPVEQSGAAPEQPHKNYMISTTKLVNSAFGDRDIRRWTDASKVPYIALPNSRRSMEKIGLKTGCYCLMVDLQTMKSCFGVYADSKDDKSSMGEVSSRAMAMMGSQSGGSVFLLVFPASGQGQGTIPDESTIQSKGREELKRFSYGDSGDHLVKAVSKITNLPARIIQAGYVSNTPFGDIDLDGEIEVIGTFGRTR